MNDQQVPALKPLYLAASKSDTPQFRSPAALHGASSAFLPKASVPVVNISSVSAGARLAALAAGTHAQRRAPSRSPERKNGATEISPVRGRQLFDNVSLSPISQRITASNNRDNTHARPALQTRSSSMLAARHASVRSRSPLDRPKEEPGHGGILLVSPKEGGKKISSPHALSGAAASMAASSVREQSKVDSVHSVKHRALNFEKLSQIPSEEPPHASSSILARSLRNAQLLEGSTAKSTDNLQIPSLHLGRERAQSATQVPTMPISFLRQSSEESAITIATSTAENVSGLKEFNRFERPQIPVRGPGSHLKLARTSPHGKLQHQDDYRAAMTVDALADAMVASSLASSRAASPSKKPPPPATRRRSRSVTSLHEIASRAEREVQTKPRKPPRPMKHTLRKRTSSDDDETELTKRGRRHWMRKHPNMHSEGARKRWRDKVTERERKRYEGVFAANRGLLISTGTPEFSPEALFDSTAAGNQVVNIVVRDIWERSRLPREVLREIYDLVSPEEAHSLNREQFVVGLWLIDQRLKGRKLPVKVSASVWASVRHSQGIKIRHQPW